MGWNDWARFGCDGLNEAMVLHQADALTSTGLAAAGYNTVTLDDCWMLTDRSADGALVVDAERFPHGMAWLADEIRRRNLHFGIYTDGGTTTCDGRAGSLGHERSDADLFASWGAEYVKYDGCNVPGKTVADYRRAFNAMRMALDRTGRRIVMNSVLPGYFPQGSPDWYESLAISTESGQQWRTSQDIPNANQGVPAQWPGVMSNYEATVDVGRVASPDAGWNDADMLIVGNGLTAEESRSHISLWAMMASPLIASTDVALLSTEEIAIMTNREVIGIDQDAAGIPAARVASDTDVDVLVRPLANGDRAVALLNRSEYAVTRTWSAEASGFTASASSCGWLVRDLWTSTTSKASPLGREWTANIAPHATALYRVSPSAGCSSARGRGQVASPSGSCLSTNTSTTEGTIDAAVVVADCRSSGTLWDRPTGERIARAGSCLTASKAGDVTLQPCGGTAAQRWRHDRDGLLTNVGNGGCLEVTDAAPGRSVTAKPCRRFDLTQIWALPV